MAVVYRYVGILIVDVVFFRSPGILHSQNSFPHSWGCLQQPGTKHRGEGILRMEDATTSEEDNIDSQDSNIPIDHGHLARNCSIKTITPAVKGLVISKLPCNNIILYIKNGTYGQSYYNAEEGHSMAKSFYFVSCLSTLICRPNDADELSEVTTALSPLLYCFSYAFPGFPYYITQ